MNTQSWVTLIACVGELAVVLLVALRASGAALATPLLLLSVDLAGWNFAQLAYHRSGLLEWHLLDMIRRRWRLRSRFTSCSGSWDARASCAGRCGRSTSTSG